MRLQLELPEARVAQLDALMEATDIATRKELFNNALSLFEWAVREARSGNTIASVNEKEGKYREIHMPALDTAAALGSHSTDGNKLLRALRMSGS